MNKIQIDPEFKSLIPPLAPEEFAQLEENITNDGCRDPLVVWRDGDSAPTLIDGHNRYEICERHGIEFETVEMKFADRVEAMLWMEENQVGRRNISDDQRSVIVDSIRERRSRAAVRERNKTGTNQHTVGLSDTLTDKPEPKPKTDTRAAVAKEFNLPERKLRNVQSVKKASPELLQKVRDGEIKLADAVRDVKRAEIVSRLEDVATVEQKALEGKYDVIVIDPPWPMVKIERNERPNQAAFEYPTMTEQEIAALEMPAADDCHMWLWTTHKFLPMAFRMLDRWGFSYVCAFVWHKPGGFQPIGLPQYNCEFALYARKGSPKFIDTKAFNTCFNAGRGSHSEKPEEFYDVVRRVTGGRRIDIFNRRKIEGFDVWGKESK